MPPRVLFALDGAGRQRPDRCDLMLRRGCLPLLVCCIRAWEMHLCALTIRSIHEGGGGAGAVQGGGGGGAALYSRQRLRKLAAFSRDATARVARRRTRTPDGHVSRGARLVADYEEGFDVGAAAEQRRANRVVEAVA